MFSLISMRNGRTDPGSRIGTIGILRERDGRDLKQIPRASPTLNFGAPKLTIMSNKLELGPPKLVKKKEFLTYCLQKHKKHVFLNYDFQKARIF